jgi:beta-galactosidase
MKRMKTAGLNTVQLWAVWGWMEPEEGLFVYDDYDRLVELAERNGLKVVISTITDLQPFWLPRLYPHTGMVDEFGQPIHGTPREECLPGLTPGQCTDHPEVRRLSVRFMQELAARYRNAPMLAGWDCWNETRWCVACERWVCYCDATIRAFRAWLKQRHGTLEALGDRWGRRLASWEDVLPARRRSLLNPALLDWLRFVIHRAHEMGRWRRDALWAGDPDHPIVAHAGGPVTRNRCCDHEEAPFARGNDFDTGPDLDAFGTSAFPAWFAFDNTSLGIWLEVTRSVARPKPMWQSELQGGAYNQGFDYGIEVTGALQQYWTWQAYGRGAKAVLYWAWRDETWGVEAGGYGIDGQDGMAGDRIRALRQTRRLLNLHAGDLNAYTPDPAEIGVLYDTDNGLLAIVNREGHSNAATLGLNGCMVALERQRLAFDLLDGRRLSIPDDIRLLLLPAAFCLKADATEAIERFLRRGGWVYCEAGTGTFLENGFFVERAERRALVGALGIGVRRRRGNRVDASCETVPGAWAKSPRIALKGGLWSMALEAPGSARVLGRDALGEAMLIEVRVGKGRLIMSGSFPSFAYGEKAHEGFEQFIQALVSASGAAPRWRLESDEGLTGLSVRTGRSGRKRLFFLLNAGSPKTVTVHPFEKESGPVKEWVTARILPRKADGGVEIEMRAPCHRILEWRSR